jgi:hypothetical protein
MTKSVFPNQQLLPILDTTDQLHTEKLHVLRNKHTMRTKFYDMLATLNGFELIWHEFNNRKCQITTCAHAQYEHSNGSRQNAPTIILNKNDDIF